MLVVLAVIGGSFYFAFKTKEIQKTSRPKITYTEDEQKLLNQAKEIFAKYQADWSNFNVDSMKSYMTKSYHARAILMMKALQNLHRQNRISDLDIRGADIMGKVDVNAVQSQKINIKFYFGGLDELVDQTNGQIFYSQKVTNISETWTFEYENGILKLSAISQPTESRDHLKTELHIFAAFNKMFYSADWGRYALPTRGLIFDKASLSVSDVNNHIIGEWNNTLVQLYTYAQQPSNPKSYYIVGQLTVPKHYSGIIVKHAKSKYKMPKNYQKYELEWGDFNKKYDVWATNIDKVTSFELLNPKFMADLYDKNRQYSIEVVDNVIYIFAPVSGLSKNDYDVLLNILLAVYHELKM